MGVVEVVGLEEFNVVVSGNGVVLVDFYTRWCLPCKMLKPVLEKISSKYDDLKVVAVDLDIPANQGIGNIYGITAVPTLILFKNGKEVHRRVGFSSERNLVAWLDKCLSEI